MFQSVLSNLVLSNLGRTKMHSMIFRPLLSATIIKIQPIHCPIERCIRRGNHQTGCVRYQCQGVVCWRLAIYHIVRSSSVRGRQLAWLSAATRKCSDRNRHIWTIRYAPAFTHGALDGGGKRQDGDRVGSDWCCVFKNRRLATRAPNL
jgi:hypothetical protein